METNTNITIQQQPNQVNNRREEEWQSQSWFFWGILLIILILFFLTRQDYGSYPAYAQAASLPATPVQMNVIHDKLYLVNGNTGVISVVDTKTDQLKTMLPFR
ncbi:hypothetical protein [Bacillus sp. 196mf]|uniref:hypothetical protein n=1 Tax=Bacillus sp. 196mf TaxID=1761754 RepID=UPI000D7C72DC|nr:hypothetical protein [Bacillus sp. 196mf]PYE88562.1 hypothetical protein ATL10_10449 [Bacillus sp. 196mf]